MATGIESLTDLLKESRIEPYNLQYMKGKRLEDAGRYIEALRVYRTALQKQELVLGHSSWDTVRTKWSMARILYLLGEYDEALPMFEDVYSTMKEIGQPETRQVLLARGYVANILRKTGKDALNIYQEIYEIQSKRWPHASFTLATKTNIALELSDRGEYDESLKMFDELSSLHMQIKSYRKSVWSTLSHKSFVLCKQGKYSEALYIAEFLHENKKSVLGEEHPETINQLRCKGIILADQSEYDQAESTMKALIEQLLKHNGELEFVEDKMFLALILKKRFKFDESLSLFKRLYMIVREKPTETISLLTTKLLVQLLDQQGQYDEALQLYKEVLEMDKPDSPDNLITVKNIKRITDQQESSKKSGPSPNELYEIESKCFWEICEYFKKLVAEYGGP